MVELLVVIAIIGILAAAVFPAMQAARQAARRTQCKNNLGRIVLAVSSYEMSQLCFPIGTTDTADSITHDANGNDQNWLLRTMPFLDEPAIFGNVDQSISIYSPANQPARMVMPSYLACPSDFKTVGKYPETNYAGAYNDTESLITTKCNGIFILNIPTKVDDITDGLSQTVFVGEKINEGGLGYLSGTRATLRNGTPLSAQPPSGIYAVFKLPKTEKNVDNVPLPDDSSEQELDVVRDPMPRLKTITPTDPAIAGGFSSRHSGGLFVGLGDGSVMFLNQTISPTVFQQMIHKSDGSLVDLAK